MKKLQPMPSVYTLVKEVLHLIEQSKYVVTPTVKFKKKKLRIFENKVLKLGLGKLESSRCLYIINQLSSKYKMESLWHYSSIPLVLEDREFMRANRVFKSCMTRSKKFIRKPNLNKLELPTGIFGGDYNPNELVKDQYGTKKYVPRITKEYTKKRYVSAKQSPLVTYIASGIMFDQNDDIFEPKTKGLTYEEWANKILDGDHDWIPYIDEED